MPSAGELVKDGTYRGLRVEEKRNVNLQNLQTAGSEGKRYGKGVLEKGTRILGLQKPDLFEKWISFTAAEPEDDGRN